MTLDELLVAFDRLPPSEQSGRVEVCRAARQQAMLIANVNATRKETARAERMAVAADKMARKESGRVKGDGKRNKRGKVVGAGEGAGEG